MSNRSPVLVVGSYPPIPVPASAASVGAVQRAWADGADVITVSPRLSAAHLSVPVVGILAGRRLENVRRRTGASELVLVIERGLPIRGGSVLREHAASWLLARTLRRFEDVTVVRVGDPGLRPSVERRIAAEADHVLEHAGDSHGPIGVTAVGPPETLPRERPRQILGIVARRLLGARASTVRAQAATALRSARTIIGRPRPGSRPS